MSNDIQWRSGSLDEYLSPRPNPKTAVRDLVSPVPSVSIESKSGSRVAFKDSVSSLLTYPNPPKGGSLGTIVTVRTAMGTTTHHDGQVFVKWDSGDFGSYYPRDLLPASSRGRISAGDYRRVVSASNDLDDFLRTASTGSDLVHKATKDLWTLKKNGDEYAIERLFDDNGSPLKV